MPSLMKRVLLISRCSSLYRAEHLTEIELIAPYHIYVLTICTTPGLSQDKLARKLCLSKSNVTRHIAFLEQNGYVERKVSCKDKREMLVFPTQKMLDIHPKIIEIEQKWNSLVTDEISEQDLEIFNNVLKKILDKSLSTVNMG